MAALAALVACSPALNWREVDGVDGQRWWFPCKPERTEREVALQGQRLAARLAACEAQGLTWSGMAVQFPGPAEAAAALATLRGTFMTNLQAEASAPPPGLVARVDGLQWLAGRGAAGDAVAAAARFRVQGRWLVQQVVLTPPGQPWPRALTGDALEVFFEDALARP